MEDLAPSEALGGLVGTMHGRGRLINAVGHGPAGLLSAADRSALAWWAGLFPLLDRRAAEHRRFP